MKKQVTVVKGVIAQDQRGQIRFVNDFDMKQIRRFYLIANRDTELTRGWRGHRREQRWLYAVSGSFSVDLVVIDDWERPSRDTPIETWVLKHADQQVLCIPSGWAMAFRALQPDSEMLVFADHLIEDAESDDYTWPLDYFRLNDMSQREWFK